MPRLTQLSRCITHRPKHAFCFVFSAQPSRRHMRPLSSQPMLQQIKLTLPHQPDLLLNTLDMTKAVTLHMQHIHLPHSLHKDR